MARDRYSGDGAGRRRYGSDDQMRSGRPNGRGDRSRSYDRASAPLGGGRGGSGGYRGGSGRGRGSVKTDLLHSDLAHENIPRRTVALGVLGAGMLAGIAQLMDYQVVNAGTYRDRAD